MPGWITPATPLPRQQLMHRLCLPSDVPCRAGSRAAPVPAPLCKSKALGKHVHCHCWRPPPHNTSSTHRARQAVALRDAPSVPDAALALATESLRLAGVTPPSSSPASSHNAASGGFSPLADACAELLVDLKARVGQCWCLCPKCRYFALERLHMHH